MRTFDLMSGTQTFTLDDAGSVKAAAADFGTWATNATNQIVVTKTGGGDSTIDVGWRFDGNNHLCIDQNGDQVFDVNGDGSTNPVFRLDRAVLFVKPEGDAPFEFAIRAKWNITAGHDLEMSAGGVTSKIDGVINDRNSAFRFRFVDKLDVIETFSLLFKGSWKNSPDPTAPAAVIYEYEIADSPTPGVFKLPNALVVDNNSLVLAYNYDKAGRKQSVQLVGQFSFNNFELNYAIERKTAAEGTSTTLKFDVDVKGKSADGKIVFVLKRTDTGAATTTELSVGGSFTARFKNGVLTVGLAFSQKTINGTVSSRSVMFTGSLVHNGGASFTWALAAINGSIDLAIAATDIQLGPVTVQTKITLVMQDGTVQGVQGLFGISF